MLENSNGLLINFAYLSWCAEKATKKKKTNMFGHIALKDWLNTEFHMHFKAVLPIQLVCETNGATLVQFLDYHD